MQPNPWLILGALALLASPAAAQAVLHCDDLKADQPQEAFRAFACLERAQDELADAQRRIDALESRLDALDGLSLRIETLAAGMNGSQDAAVPAVGNHPDTRAIVAYVSAKGEKTCPSGWVPFEAAKDRFILGAGAAYPVVGTTGGEAEVTLSEAQMPSHSHDLARVSVANDLGWRDAGTSTNVPYFNVSASQSARGVKVGRASAGVFEAGGGQAHTNMPPYIALYFCQKAE
ncbi:hypothetical protein [uncultured Tateyamaria sp.]|uniref:hypothetical protein n=1 Tax=uncultured Tateyamaria sp. TaxID=455651 RepID=UPI002609CBB1|nr:hypothetical protein [uncultured Tateyamaria sp.]